MADTVGTEGGYKKFKKNRRNDRFIQAPVKGDTWRPPNMGTNIGRGGYGHESLHHINAKPHKYLEEYKQGKRKG
jgi:hypothetical protein